LYSTIIIALGVAVGWCALFYRYKVSTPSVFWLPIVDLAGVGFALYLDSDLSGSLHDVEELEGLKYEFKRI